jgi:hypothetical protein
MNDWSGALCVMDNPQTTSSTTYSLSNTGLSFASEFMILDEIMG